MPPPEVSGVPDPEPVMSPFRRPGTAHRAVALLLLSLVASGCTTWQTAKVTPQVLLETEKPRHVRVTARDDTRQIMRGPRIATDTLLGLRGWRGKDSVAVDLRSVSRIEVQRVSAVKTTALVVVIGGMIAGLIAMSGMEGWSMGGVY
jgi:hypothetical protein